MNRSLFVHLQLRTCCSSKWRQAKTAWGRKKAKLRSLILWHVSIRGELMSKHRLIEPNKRFYHWGVCATGKNFLRLMYAKENQWQRLTFIASSIKSGATEWGFRKKPGNEMKNVEIGKTMWLITALRRATPTMPRVTSDTLLTHISLQFLHDDSLRAAVSGPAFPCCCQSGSHSTSSN